MTQAIFQVLKYIPATTARKALEKVNPGFKNYFSSAISYGVDANRALDFLMDRFESDSQKEHKEYLKRGQANKTLRPDEQASKAMIERNEIPAQVAKTAASFALGGGLGGLGQSNAPQEEEGSPMVAQQLGPEHQPGLGQFQGEHQPGLGQFKGAHQPGLGQVQEENGPRQKSERELALINYNKMQREKRALQQAQEEFERLYGSQQSPETSQGYPRGQQSQGKTNNLQRLEGLIQRLKQSK
jgi:hypothetical protein